MAYCLPKAFLSAWLLCYSMGSFLNARTLFFIMWSQFVYWVIVLNPTFLDFVRWPVFCLYRWALSTWLFFFAGITIKPDVLSSMMGLCPLGYSLRWDYYQAWRIVVHDGILSTGIVSQLLEFCSLEYGLLLALGLCPNSPIVAWWRCSSVGRAWDGHVVDAGSIPRCGKGFFSQIQLSVQTLSQCPYTPVWNHMRLHLCAR